MNNGTGDSPVHSYTNDPNLAHAARLASEAATLLRGGMDPTTAARLLRCALDAVRVSHKEKAERNRRVSSGKVNGKPNGKEPPRAAEGTYARPPAARYFLPSRAPVQPGFTHEKP